MKFKDLLARSRKSASTLATRFKSYDYSTVVPKIKPLSKGQKIIALAGIGLLVTIAATNKQDQPTKEALSTPDKNFQATASGSRYSARVADHRLAMSKKDIRFPYNIGPITIESMSINYYSYQPKYGKKINVVWRAYIKNNTDSEIEATISICDSANTAVGNPALNEASLADCSPVKLRLLPNWRIEKAEFAKSNVKYIRRGAPIRLCIRGKGCFEANYK